MTYAGNAAAGEGSVALGHVFLQPPFPRTGSGATRRVGIEVEFAGLGAEAAVRALATRFGGTIRERDAHAFVLEASTLGDITVELDTRYAHPESARALLGSIGATLAPLIGAASGFFVPCEFMAVVPLDRLGEIDEAVAVLRAAGARGTQDSAVYAFGLHLNPELPDLEAPTVAAFVKAFALLDPWLRRQVAPDSTRALLGFAEPFPEPYIRLVVAPAYWPDLDRFVDDYLAFNPTRNRDLDVLPLLAYLRQERVRAALPAEKIRERPTLHYRLPDARVSDPGWSIAPDWNRWVAVERLAAGRARLDAVGQAYLAFEGQAKSWSDMVERIAVA